MKLGIGPLELATNLCLSPLAGYTNLPFRRVIRWVLLKKIGKADLVTGV
ncbi:tRNA dihydrouridine synthase DusB, partial [bacterium]|nr:tRNA dihydrouridine synthase DusB [bacterium]